MEFLAANGAAIVFWVFASLAVVSALGVVTQRNPMYCAISLLVTFVSVATLFLLRGAEFLFVVQIFVYGGGIMVLFLFVIMLVNLHQLPQVKLWVSHLPLALVILVLFVAMLGVAIGPAVFALANPDPGALVRVEGEALGNSEAVAWVLYRDYLLPFEIASVFLLVAMIGAVVLGRRD